jgi:phosphonate transport system ATP-binding protein
MTSDVSLGAVAPDNPETLLELRGVSVRYGDALALDTVTLQVKAGEFVVLLGPSGAGKSTVFRCLSGLVRPALGEVHTLGSPLGALDGRALRKLRRAIGLVFQQHNLIGRLSAVDNVLTGTLARTPLWRVLARRFRMVDRQRALGSLDRVGLLDYAYRRADSLSGGQQQRVAIARVLAQGGRVLLADEPVASLDPESARHVLATLARIARDERMAVLCSLHQVGLACEHADRLIGLRGGRVICDLPARSFDQRAERDLYGGGEAACDPDDTAEPCHAAEAGDR